MPSSQRRQFRWPVPLAIPDLCVQPSAKSVAPSLRAASVYNIVVVHAALGACPVHWCVATLPTGYGVGGHMTRERASHARASQAE